MLWGPEERWESVVEPRLDRMGLFWYKVDRLDPIVVRLCKLEPRFDVAGGKAVDGLVVERAGLNLAVGGMRGPVVVGAVVVLLLFAPGVDDCFANGATSFALSRWLG